MIIDLIQYDSFLSVIKFPTFLPSFGHFSMSLSKFYFVQIFLSIVIFGQVSPIQDHSTRRRLKGSPLFRPEGRDGP